MVGLGQRTFVPAFLRSEQEVFGVHLCPRGFVQRCHCEAPRGALELVPPLTWQGHAVQRGLANVVVEFLRQVSSAMTSPLPRFLRELYDTLVEPSQVRPLAQGTHNCSRNRSRRPHAKQNVEELFGCAFWRDWSGGIVGVVPRTVRQIIIARTVLETVCFAGLAMFLTANLLATCLPRLQLQGSVGQCGHRSMSLVVSAGSVGYD